MSLVACTGMSLVGMSLVACTHCNTSNVTIELNCNDLWLSSRKALKNVRIDSTYHQQEALNLNSKSFDGSVSKAISTTMGQSIEQRQRCLET